MILACIHQIVVPRTFLLLALIGFDFSALSQTKIEGEVVDSGNGEPLAYVNIGIKQKDVGIASLRNGSFSISIPSEYQTDTLTFSMVGYHELNVPIGQLNPEKSITVRLEEKITELKELVILQDRLSDKKYGIKKRGVIHFTDGMFKKDDCFEIGQVINVGDNLAQVTSVNLHLNSSRQDSASFRVNFYRYDEDDNRPAERVFEKSILQRHPVHEGWLKFDLMSYNILLKGKVFVSIEFIPEGTGDAKQIYYEVKIGGTSKSFFRRNSMGQWSAPPHHYCLYVTALVDKRTPEEADDEERLPTITLQSHITREFYSLFIRLPKDYEKNTSKRYPVVYHLDGNAYFDPMSASADRLLKKKKIRIDPIVVGIGYENAYVMDSLRNRDYTFPEAHPKDSFRISGGGAKFYRFIKSELKPYIEKTYRTDTTNRTIMGHSLGGYFVLYALLQDISGDRFFNHYVAASPSISYDDDYIVKQFDRLSFENVDNRKSDLYLSTGSLEVAEDTSNSFKHFTRLLSGLNGIDLKVKIYNNMEHMGTAVLSFEDGLEFIFSD